MRSCSQAFHFQCQPDTRSLTADASKALPSGIQCPAGMEFSLESTAAIAADLRAWLMGLPGTILDEDSADSSSIDAADFLHD